MERFKMIASAYLMLIRGDSVLLARRFQTGYEDGKYGLPAGHVEDNESLLENLVREVKEEVGLIINPARAELVHVMHRKEKDRGLPR
jgi:8-oxo-dGTP diphosphatase